MAGGIIGVFHVSRLLVGLQKSLAGAERVFGYLDTAQAEHPPEKTGGEKSAEQDVMVELREVSFRYGAVPVLDRFSLKVQKGEFVALIGSSGSGKSSVLRLIQGLYRPASGSVQIEGRNLTEWDLASLRSEVSLVPQEPVLFPGSIAENIAMGTQKVSREQVEAAAREAGAHGFISAMPLRYDTPVAERGHSLSGGQRQMIAIARALLRNSPILLFGEATSALDSETENVIYRTLSSLRKEKTILLVTHRLSALKIADRAITVSGA
jgi:ABC-type multidrug transport system fused ATPase/permease subunit